ncbi:phage tail domain-containing protein [Oceanobacillus timonensis]|uniref:phage tail domain-containing protein n=1 Tax=Oceanobacillus timonensis TaxID=1926285 RepID=UPI0009BA4F5B|nr:phage tail domain-containing protein [Oceanobacillus timonensis]
MDAQIIKQNGDSFNFEDFGVIVKDFIVSSIPIEPQYGEVEGTDRRVDYGSTYGVRTIKVPFMVRARDYHDYPLLRDLLFEKVLDKESYYIRERRRAKQLAYAFVDLNEPAKMDESTNNKFIGGKIYKVRLQNTFELEQMVYDGEGELEFETTELPFAESIGTTADIDTGNLISYADLTVASHYDFWSTIGDTSFSSSSPVSYEGYDKSFLRVSVPSAPLGDNRRIRTRYNIHLIKGKEYKLSFIGATSDWLSSDFNYTGILRSNGTFTSRLSLDKIAVGSADISGYTKTVYKYTATFIHEDDTGEHALMIGTKQTSEKGAYFIVAEPSIKTGGIGIDDGLWGYGMGLLYDNESMSFTHNAKEKTPFRIYNAGNVPIHPFEQDLKMIITDVVGSDEMFQITNHSNGSRARVNVPLNSTDTVIYDGPDVTRNNLAFLRDTRKDFVELSPGWNTLEVYYCKSARVSFDFPFYYK